MSYIYAITETDVDGCGGQAREFVRSVEPLTEEEQKLLTDCLDKAKQEAEDCDTHDMISDARDLFQDQTGKILVFTDDPVSGYLEF